MNTDWAGIRYIGCREAFVRIAYPDGVDSSKSPPAQRYSGAFGSQRPIVIPGQEFTIDEGIKRLIRHCLENDQDLNRWMASRRNQSISQHIWNALASLYYQSGIRPFIAGGDIRKLFDSDRDLVFVLEYFPQWHTNSLGQEKKGLLDRRISEMVMASSGDYGDISKFKYFDDIPISLGGTGKMEWRDFPAESPYPLTLAAVS
jgi:GH24 family phage-related lysozyme (muramidase)